MKRILIIGAKGMLGQELVRVFGADENYKVVALGRKEIDITDESAVKKIVEKQSPEIIINAAAYNAVDKAEEAEEFKIAKVLNGLAPGYLGQIAKDLGAVFIHYSTDYVFDGQNEAGYNENAEPSPISNYGFSKLKGEQEIQNIGGNYIIIRSQRLFGKPGLCENAKKSFFETMLALATTKKELEIVDEEIGNFTYAPDLAERTKYILENVTPSQSLKREKGVGIYHVTNEGFPVTWFGAAQILIELANIKEIKIIPVPADKFPRPAPRPKFSVLLNSKLPKLRPWPEALKTFLGR